jgi:hypothetical protein
MKPCLRCDKPIRYNPYKRLCDDCRGYIKDPDQTGLERKRVRTRVRIPRPPKPKRMSAFTAWDAL